MSKLKNNLSGLVDHLNQSTSGRKSGLSSLAAPGTGSPDLKAATRKLSAGTLGSSKSQSWSSKSLTGIQFGRAPHSSTSASNSATSDLTSLLKKTAGNSLSSLFGGSGALGGLFSFGSIGSLIGDLFSGSSSTAAPTFQPFTLPQPRAESFSIGGNSKAPVGGQATEQRSGIYAAPLAHASVAPAAASVSQDQIVQAVRTALLNSSSLNDVIHEI